MAVKDMDRFGIYALYFLTDDDLKIYIGSTSCSFKKRLAAHLSLLRQGKHSNLHMQRLFDQYGAPGLHILEIFDDSENIHLCEQAYIEAIPQASLLNLGPALPSAAFGMKLSPEAKQKIGETARRCWENPEYRAMQSISRSKAFKGKPFSEKHKNALSKAHKGKPLSEKHHASVIKNNQSPEFRAKVSATLKGTKFSEERRIRHAAVHQTLDFKAKISAAGKGRTAWNKGKPWTKAQRESFERRKMMEIWSEVT